MSVPVFRLPEVSEGDRLALAHNAFYGASVINTTQRMAKALEASDAILARQLGERIEKALDAAIDKALNGYDPTEAEKVRARAAFWAVLNNEKGEGK